MSRTPTPSHFARWLPCLNLGRSLILSLTLAVAATQALADIAFEDRSRALGIASNLTDTWGATWGDLDSDGYPDIYLSNHFSYGKLLVNRGDGSFDEVGREVDLSGVFSLVPGRKSTDLHAATWADLNNDGDLDLVQALGGRNPIMDNDRGLLTARTLRGTSTRMALLYDEDNNGTTDINLIGYFNSACSDDDSRRQRHWAMLTDINASGRLDVLCAVVATGFPDEIRYHGDGAPVTLPVQRNTIDAIAGDFDGDLRSDLIQLIASERSTAVALLSPTLVESHLASASVRKLLKIRTSGAITIRDLNEAAWIARDRRNGSAQIGLTGRQSADTFTLNPGDPQNHGLGAGSGLFIGYQPQEQAWHIALESGSYDVAHLIVETELPVTEADVELGPLTVGADLASPPVYTVHGANGLEPVAPAVSGLPDLYCATGVSGDFDNDMDLDLYLGCRTPAANTRNRLFENLGDGTFVEVLNHGGEGPLGGMAAERRGAADSAVTADYDLDGYLDIFIANGENLRPQRIGGPKTLLHNAGGANSSVLFDLRGRRSNRDGIGAKLYLTTPDGTVQYREQNGGYHKHAQNHMRVHVGVGHHRQLSRVEVHWPSGVISTWNNLPANRVYVLDENGQAELRFDFARDTDGDGTPDVSDTDDDNDGISDRAERVALPGLAVLAWANGEEFTRLGSQRFDNGQVTSVRIDAEPTVIRVIDDDQILQGDNRIGETSDDPTQQVLYRGVARALYQDYLLEFQNSAGLSTTFIVLDADLDGDGTAGTEPEDGTYLIYHAGRQPRPGETLQRIGPVIQTTPLAYRALPGPAIERFDDDADGVPNSRDLDSDNDSIPDIVEVGLADLDDNAQVDRADAAASITAPPDRDKDGFADFIDRESANAANDGNALDIVSNGQSQRDSNGNGRIDAGDAGGGTDADDDGLDDLIDGYRAGFGNQPPTPTDPLCGEPAYDPATEPGIYLWQDCQAVATTAQWRVRIVAGGLGYSAFAGTLTGTGSLSADAVGLEGRDRLDSVPGDAEVDFALFVSNRGIDGFNIELPVSGTRCFNVTTLPTRAGIFVGSQRQTPVVPFNLEDLSVCR